MGEMSRAEAVRQAWAAIRGARTAFDAGDLARVSVLMEVSTAWSRIAEVMGDIPPAELSAVSAPVPQLRPDETVILPIQQQGQRTTINATRRHVFVPGPDPSFCGYPVSDRLNCALYAQHSVHTTEPEPFAPGHMPREFLP